MTPAINAAVFAHPNKQAKWHVAKFLLRYLGEWGQKHDVSYGYKTNDNLPEGIQPQVVYVEVGKFRVELMTALMVMDSHCVITFNGMEPAMCPLGEQSEWAIAGFLESERVRWLINLLKHGCITSY